jgi:hypothetical protein
MDNTRSRTCILIQINIEKPGEKINMSDKEKIISALQLISGKKGECGEDSRVSRQIF